MESSKKKKLLFLLQYDDLGSSSKYRVLIYKGLFDNDYQTSYSHFWSNRYVSKYMKNKKKYVAQIVFSYLLNFLKRLFIMLFIAKRYDIVFIQRCVFPGVRPFGLKRIKKAGKSIFFDIDDSLHLNSKYFSNKIASLSNVVLTGSQELFNHYKEYNSNVVLIPTIDNDNSYLPFVKNTFKNKCIGWIGSHSTIANLKTISNQLNRFFEKHPDSYLKVISDSSGGLEEFITNFVFSKWDKNTYIDEMSEFSVGIMPLENNEFNKGKCGFKLIQYLDLKKPVVASDVGGNSEIVNNYGFVCRNNDDWFIMLEDLLYNEQTYNNCVANIKNDFLSKYGFFNTYKRIVSLIENNT